MREVYLIILTIALLNRSVIFNFLRRIEEEGAILRKYETSRTGTYDGLKF